MADKNEIKPKYMLFCDYALISSDGKLSIIGEFDHYFSGMEQPVLGKAFLVANIQAKPNSNHNLTLRLVDQKEKEIVFTNPINVNSNEEGRVTIILGLDSITFNDYGFYKAQIINGKTKVAECPLHIVKVQNQKPAES